MSAVSTRERCANCDAEHSRESLDDEQWCAGCRAVIVRRASWVARVVGVLFAFGVATLIGLLIEPTRFLVLWAGLIVASYVIAMKLVRRVAFDVIRGRVTPPEELE